MEEHEKLDGDLIIDDFNELVQVGEYLRFIKESCDEGTAWMNEPRAFGEAVLALVNKSLKSYNNVMRSLTNLFEGLQYKY